MIELTARAEVRRAASSNFDYAGKNGVVALERLCFWNWFLFHKEGIRMR